MSFLDAITTCISKIFTIDGRARRSEYWYFVIFVSVISAVIYAIMGQESMVANIITALLSISSLTVGIRRLHDIGKSGWWILLDMLPIIGWIILFIWHIKDSDPGANQYGENPKGVQAFQ